MLTVERHAADRPLLVWRFPVPRRCISSAPVGGGLGNRSWVLDAEVATDFARQDLHTHVASLAAAAGCVGPGVGMLTAASVDRWATADDGEVVAWATVGISKPTWAADADGAMGVWRPGTVNVVIDLPARLSDAALVNAVMTATEAKTQALLDRGVPGTGTASDAVCVCCPTDGPEETFGGPRSTWGARLARAVHRAVLDGMP